MRVVSLVPSATETLRSWGIDPVACTRFCEQPDLAAVGGTKDPDVDAVVALAPDLVVVDEEESRLEDHDALVGAGLEVHVLAIRDLADLDEQLPGLAARVGATWDPVGPVVREGATLGAGLRAFVPIWRRPWMALGRPTYGASLLAALGVTVVPSDMGPYPAVTLDAVAAGADLVLAPSEPYPFRERHVAELSAVGQVHLVDGQDLFWWGARTPAAIARLGAVVAAIAGPS